MKRFFMFGLLFCFCFFFEVNCYADECNADEIERLKELANGISMNSEFDYEAVDYGIFNRNIVSVYGLTSDFYVMLSDFSVGFFYHDVQDGVVSKNVFSDNGKFQVYSLTCPNIVLKEFRLSLKVFNQYSLYEECNGITEEELDVCGKFYDGDITYDQFVKKVERYKEKKSSGVPLEVEEGLLVFIKKHYFVFGMGIFIIILITIVFVRKKMKQYELR